MTTKESTLDQFKTEEKGSHISYQEYKQVDIEKFGTVPQAWKVHKLKQVSDIFPSNVDKKEKDDENNIFLCNYTEVYDNPEITPDLDFMEATAKKRDIDRLQLQEGDVIITKDSESWNDIGVPSYVSATMEDVICGYHLTYIKPHKSKINGKFLYYFLESEAGSHHLHIEANGVTRYGISINGIKEAPIIVPPKEEQEAIVHFLNSETRNVEKLIEKKEKLIQLLEEKRTSLIKNVVSNGIVSDKNQRQSGVEWLGDIPKHWEVRDLRYLAEIDTGGKDTKDAVDDGDYPFFVRSQTKERIDSYSYDGEAVLTAGDGVGVGKVFHYIDGKFDYHQRVYKISDFPEDVDGKYLYYYLKANLKMEIFKNNAKSTVDSLRMPMFKSFPIAFGSLEEQRSIVNYLDNQNEEIDNLIEKVRKGIERLKEYRTALITEAVTGQIDVRGEV